jgi:transposase
MAQQLRVICRDKACRHVNVVTIDPFKPQPFSSTACARCGLRLGIDSTSIESLRLTHPAQT